MLEGFEILGAVPVEFYGYMTHIGFSIKGDTCFLLNEVEHKNSTMGLWYSNRSLLLVLICDMYICQNSG